MPATFHMGKKYCQHRGIYCPMIPGLEIVEMKNSDTCCGSAGVYNILQPDLAEDILERKIENIEDTKADCVVAGNPGCLLQIQKGLRENNQNLGHCPPDRNT